MAKFIKVTQQAGTGSPQYYSLIVNIEKIQCAVGCEGDRRLTTIYFNSGDSDGLSLVVETPDEIHALIEAAQAEPPLVDYMPGDEPVTAVDLAQLTAEQKADALADCLAGLPSI